MAKSSIASSTIVRRLILILAVGGAAVILVELFARYGLGLGTPPLSSSHPKIEYQFKPHQDLKRFGNRFKVNSYGMRSDDFPAQPAQGEQRILVFGDSVVVGGSQLDQRVIATEQLRERLVAASPAAQVIVGNVSAGSWGPGNWQAWLNRYGHLGASKVILVVSSHDLEDHPTFESLNPFTHPQENPPSATHELLMRYLNSHSVMNKIRSLGLFRQSSPVTFSDSTPRSEGTTQVSHDTPELSGSQQRGLAELRDLIMSLQRLGVPVGIVQFWERDEMMSGRPRPEHPLLLQLFKEMDVPVVQSADFFRRCSPNPAVDLFVDHIHPYTEAGQRCLADAMEAAVRALPSVR